MIEKHKDPKTRKEYLLAVGKVDGVYINELKEKKTYSGPKGPWTPTHSVNIIVDGTRIGLGLTDKESVRAKDINDQYQDVERGAEVSIVVEENGEYKGVTQYQGRTSGITILQVAPKQEQKTGGQTYTSKPRDNSGVETGHALNGALNLVRGDVVQNDYESVIEAAQFVHNVTVALKKEYAAKNPEMSEYDVGAMVGHAVLNATRDSSDLDDLESEARDLLDNVVPSVAQYVKSSKQESSSKVDDKPKTNTRRVPRVAEQQTSSASTGLDLDDDIPF